MSQDLSGYDSCAFTAEAYDYIGPYAARPDIPFYVEMAQKAEGPVLELGCGTGRVLIPTARAGVRITGVDLSNLMLGTCRERLAGEPEEVRQRAELHQADMRRFDLQRKDYALVTTPFRCFQHLLETEAQLDTLRAIHSHLRPGGKLVLEMFNPSIPIMAREGRDQEQSDEEPFEMPDGRTVERRYRVLNMDHAHQRYDVHMIYYITHPDGRTDRLAHHLSMRYIFRWEAEHMLARSGFEIEAVYGFFDRSPVCAESSDLIFVAKRG